MTSYMLRLENTGIAEPLLKPIDFVDSRFRIVRRSYAENESQRTETEPQHAENEPHCLHLVSFVIRSCWLGPRAHNLRPQ